MREKINESKKEPLKIQGFTITTLLAYFIIYSIIGFIIETIFGILTKGVLESRKSFIIGPFCSIYGLGAVIMILALQKFKKNNYTLFFGGFLVGSIIEYVVSLIGEAIFHVVWWDYSDMAFNINGRICLETMIPFGFAGLILLYVLNPFFESLLNSLPQIFLNISAFILLTSFIIDNIITTKIIFNITTISKNIKTDSTERINKLIRKRIEKNNKILQKRILHAFPKLKFLSIKIKRKRK